MPRRTSRLSEFDDQREVQRLKSCLYNAFEAEMESNPSFQTPEVPFYAKIFVIPIFRVEMQQASDSWVYENYDSKENADRFDSNY